MNVWIRVEAESSSPVPYLHRASMSEQQGGKMSIEMGKVE